MTTTTRTVIGTWFNQDRNTPAKGYIKFSQYVRVIVTGEYISIPDDPIRAKLDKNGSINVQLPVTGIGDPEGWLWMATEEIGEGSTRYWFELPESPEPLDLSEVAPRIYDTPGPFVPGPTGPKGETGDQGEQGPQGPQGDPGVATFNYEQTQPNQIWTMQHNLGFYPSVTIVDSGGTEVIGSIEYLDINTVRVTFNAAFGGTAYFS